MRQTFNQKGMSIVEGLVALGAIAGLAAAIATISTNTQDKSSIYERACQSLAVNAVDSITDEGIYHRVFHFTPSATMTSISPSSPLFSIKEIKDDDLWKVSDEVVPNPVDGGDAPVVLKNEILVKGAMRALNSLFNHDTLDFCADFVEYEPMSVENLNLTNELVRSSTTPPVLSYKITRIADGGFEGCPPSRPWFISPKSGIGPSYNAMHIWSYDTRENGIGTFAMSIDGMASRRAEAHLNARYRFTSKVEYSYKGEDKECTFSRDYHYPDDNQAPSTENISVEVVKNTSRFKPFAYDCAYLDGGNMTRKVDIVIKNTDVETGSVLLCRDISQGMVYEDASDVSEKTVSPLCFKASPGSTSADVWGRVDPVEAKTDTAAFSNAAASEDKWFPCHAARICSGVNGAPQGIAPNNSAVLGANNEMTQFDGVNPITLSLSYNGVPPDCVVGIQVVAVDTAGNVSGKVDSWQDIPAASTNADKYAYLLQLDGPTISPPDPMYEVTTPFSATLPISRLSTDNHSREIHRPWCGDRRGVGYGQIGTSGSKSWGIENDWGILCSYTASPTDEVDPTGDRLTPHWSGPGNSDIAANPVNATLKGYGVPAAPENDWTKKFPNGYYTCRRGGCCYSPTPGVCTPWSDETVGVSP